MKKLLVIGSSGQVGRFLVRKLINQKIPFFGVDIQFDEILKKSQFLKADITKEKDLQRIKSELGTCNRIIHLVSRIDASNDVIKNGISSINLNLNGTLNLLKFVPNLQHICFASSYMVYGIPNSNLVTEEHTSEPTTVYGATKLITEKFLDVYSKEKKIKLSILRFMGIYGLESPYAIQAIPLFVKAIANNQKPILFGKGKTRRNHVYVDDAIDGILACVNSGKPGVFNIGGPDAPTNLDLINIINEKMNKKIKPQFKNTMERNNNYDFIVDISKAGRKLGFKPSVKIDDGIKKTVERYMKILK